MVSLPLWCHYPPRGVITFVVFIVSSAYGMTRGIVKSFAADKGYGFITNPDGDDIFFHRKNVKKGEAEPLKGDTVDYTTSQKFRNGEASVEAIDVSGGTKPAFSAANPTVGFIRRFNNDKGFGFVSLEDEDIFCHKSEVIDPEVLNSLAKFKKCAVEMQVVVVGGKKSAIHVRRLFRDKAETANVDAAQVQDLVAKTVAESLAAPGFRPQVSKEQQGMSKKDVENMINEAIAPLKQEMKEVKQSIASIGTELAQEIRKNLSALQQEVMDVIVLKQKALGDAITKRCQDLDDMYTKLHQRHGRLQEETSRQMQLVTQVITFQMEAQAGKQEDPSGKYKEPHEEMQENNDCCRNKNALDPVRDAQNMNPHVVKKVSTVSRKK